MSHRKGVCSDDAGDETKMSRVMHACSVGDDNRRNITRIIQAQHTLIRLPLSKAIMR